MIIKPSLMKKSWHLYSLDKLYKLGLVLELREEGEAWGRCPFHKDNNPSFSVNLKRGVYYCFGCHQGGSYLDLLRLLGSDEPEDVNEEIQNLKQRLLDVQKPVEIRDLRYWNIRLSQRLRNLRTEENFGQIEAILEELDLYLASNNLAGLEGLGKQLGVYLPEHKTSANTKHPGLKEGYFSYAQ